MCACLCAQEVAVKEQLAVSSKASRRCRSSPSVNRVRDLKSECITVGSFVLGTNPSHSCSNI